jgi:hypothetical protein
MTRVRNNAFRENRETVIDDNELSKALDNAKSIADEYFRLRALAVLSLLRLSGKRRTEISWIPLETPKGLKGICFYLIGNYLAKQSFERMSWGYLWVFPGFVRKWKGLIEKYGFKSALYLWKKFLSLPLVITRQIKLTKFINLGTTF